MKFFGCLSETHDIVHKPRMAKLGGSRDGHQGLRPPLYRCRRVWVPHNGGQFLEVYLLFLQAIIILSGARCQLRLKILDAVLQAEVVCSRGGRAYDDGWFCGAANKASIPNGHAFSRDAPKAEERAVPSSHQTNKGST